MVRNVRVGKPVAIGLSLLVLLLAGGAAGCASGGRQYEREVTADELRQAFEQGKQLGENIMQVIQAYRN